MAVALDAGAIDDLAGDEMKAKVHRNDALPYAMAPPLSPVTAFPSTADMLVTGGDARIVCDPIHGLNKYGCPSAPEPTVLAYGSSTASTISAASFAAAERLRCRLLEFSDTELRSVTYARELARIRSELLNLYGLTEFSGVDVIFAASGTDIHLFAAQLAVEIQRSPLLAIMVEPTETGSGVPAALAGRHFSDCAAFGGLVDSDASIFGGGAVEVSVVAGRDANGSPRSPTVIDAEVTALVASASAAGRRVLLTMVDVSKTGLIVPSPACVADLSRRYPTTMDVLVDACQFRLAQATLRAYLARGFWVAVTGSKFISGPAFSGALLIPEKASRRLRGRPMPSSLSAYSARSDWPKGWTIRSALADVENYGLLLRWEAALAEIRAFRSLAEPDVATFLKAFAAAVSRRLTADPAFEPVPVPVLDRRPLSSIETWDNIQTIFPFLLRRLDRDGRYVPLTRDETQRVYKLLGQDLRDFQDISRDAMTNENAARRCQLGQPVACGRRNGIAVSGLRLCLSMRLIADAIGSHGRGPDVVIAEALTVLDKAAFITRTVFRSASECSEIAGAA